MNFKSIAVLLTAAAAPAYAGPLAYGICQTGCNGLAVACYAGAGFTFGVALPVAPAAVVGCNVALGGCMAACAVVALTPTL
ncbi:cysteine-rich protein [Suillus clintonianus]|uniref:cysteine-rich protein n=1 Tax=Suillus clintonianus TaxID=1904413 RepID=UPI001B85B86B|nr:cysteine-rich protein [Suillus clintonianus]KAG2121237.1 cysteine-rich protein [Suillus clintonianus]